MFLPQSTSPSILDVTVVSSTCYTPPERVPCPCPHVCTAAQALAVTARFPGLHVFARLLTPTRAISKRSSDPVTPLRDSLQPPGGEGPDSGTCRCIGRLVCMLPPLAGPQPDPPRSTPLHTHVSLGGSLCPVAFLPPSSKLKASTLVPDFPGRTGGHFYVHS